MAIPFFYVFIDCETTGLPKSKLSPFLVQLAWSVHDSLGVVIEEKEFVVKPEGFEIPQSATNVHGISQEKALREGLPLPKVLQHLNFVLNRPCSLLIGHNIDFDTRVLMAEFQRVRIETVISEIPSFCTMKETTQICRLPKHGGEYKWPSLGELHLHLFNRRHHGAHNALNDVRATARCFFELLKNGQIPSVERSIEAIRQRAEEQERQRQHAEAERQRAEEQERQRQRTEAERQRAEEERQRQRTEAERQRAEEERQRQRTEAERLIQWQQKAYYSDRKWQGKRILSVKHTLIDLHDLLSAPPPPFVKGKRILLVKHTLICLLAIIYLVLVGSVQMPPLVHFIGASLIPLSFWSYIIIQRRIRSEPEETKEKRQRQHVEAE